MGILWLDEADSWVINDYIPYDTITMGGHVFYYESYCEGTTVTTPVNCSGTWPLQQGFEDIDADSSNAVMFAVESGSDEASNCMAEPNEGAHGSITQSINLCFDDGFQSEASNPLSGLYEEGTVTWNNRHIWVQKGGDYFLYYDAPTRFWVIDDTLGGSSYFTSPDVAVYCLQWDELQPFECDTWYFYNSTVNANDERPQYDGEDEVRTTKVQTMHTGVCSTSTAGASSTIGNGATSAGAVTGYVLALLVLICVIIAAMVYRKRSRLESNYSFDAETEDNNYSAPSGLAQQATGGISADSFGTIELENAKDGNNVTGKQRQAVPADSTTMTLEEDGDGDFNVTGTEM